MREVGRGLWLLLPPHCAVWQCFSALLTFARPLLCNVVAARCLCRWVVNCLVLCTVYCAVLQVNGHFAATLDPLGLDKRPTNLELDPATYGFTERDLDRE